MIQLIRGILVRRLQGQLPLLQLVRTPEALKYNRWTCSIVVNRRTNIFEYYDLYCDRYKAMESGIRAQWRLVRGCCCHSRKSRMSFPGPEKRRPMALTVVQYRDYS